MAGENLVLLQKYCAGSRKSSTGFQRRASSDGLPAPDALTPKEQAAHTFVWVKLKSPNANGLTGVDLIRCWEEWCIMPLSRRDGLMCHYNCDLNNAQRFTNVMLDSEEVNSLVKKLCGEPKEACSKIGLKPFCIMNPAPEANKSNHHLPYLVFPLFFVGLTSLVVEKGALLEA